MKTTLLAFLFFAFISAKADILVDTEGNPVRNGGSYYILPALWGHGGGVGLAATGNETCPLTVVQTFSELSNGLPTKLSSPYLIAYLTTNLITEFTAAAPPECAARPAKWTIVGGEDETKQVKLVGYQNTLRGSFNIQTYHGLTYKIVFCPTDEDSCSALGISRNNKGDRILVVDNNNPFVVVFHKAASSAA
ncbi:trypsin inhibitor DE-3-like [Neltuma alba]|uniref:trypsin inhibitor DE-3-like n=1 Tax=Neltuma alba TaxID=207710 RepID=UPI0010A3E080|nr:trypsin inhibitor DE-3-like [Prosopis alba]XP_028777995.1 trypsin inhibitor DE-3-like [Prosopis alba]